MTKRQRGGYIWNQEITKAINANKSARQALGIILDENPPARWALRLALVSRYLAENLDALLELRMIDEDGRSEDR